MKNKAKPILLILSLSCVTSLVGYSAYSVGYRYSYSQSNKIQMGPAAYIVGKEDVKYTSIEKALDVAQSGDIVCVIPPELANYNDMTNKITVDKVVYEISRSCTIKQGVTLLLPTDKASASSVTSSSTLNALVTTMDTDDRQTANLSRGTAASYTKHANDDATHYLRTTVVIKEGVTLTNEGTLIVSGYLSSGGVNGGMIGHSSHSYSRIVMQKNASIVQSNSSAITRCYGFIEEETENNGSHFDLQAGKLYLPFVVHDYRGFQFSWAMTYSSNQALKDYHCSPFNQWNIRNVSSVLNCSYNGSVIGIANFWVKYDVQSLNVHVDKCFRKEVNLIGNTSNDFVQMNSAEYSSLKAKYTKSSDKAKYEFFGGFLLNQISLYMKESIVEVDLSTTYAYFPISYRQEIVFSRATGQSGTANFAFQNQRIKLLPGSKATFNAGTNITCTDFAVYSAFYDGGLGSGPTDPYRGGTSYPLKEGGLLITDGSITADSFGGTVYCNSPSLLSFSSESVLSREPWCNDASGTTIPAWKISNYLEIREQKQVLAKSFVSKPKFFVGVNSFMNSNKFLPAANIAFSTETIAVDTYQKVITFDELPDSLSIELVSNIWKILNNTSRYGKGSTASINPNAPYLCLINSELSISKDAGGINEFNAQSISISCDTALIDGKIPLYVGSSIQLSADVVDINKVYEKTISWGSLNPEIATIDQNGNLTGVSLGKCTIWAECDGLRAEAEYEVIPVGNIVSLNGITITDNKGGSSESIKGNEQGYDYHSGPHSKGTTLTLTVNVNPAEANIKAIKWTYVVRSQHDYKPMYPLNDSTKTHHDVIEGVENTSIYLSFSTGAGTTPDVVEIVCEVTGVDENGLDKTETKVFRAVQSADSCFEAGTLVTTNRGLIAVENLKKEDTILSFNHITGFYEWKPIAAVIDHGLSVYSILRLSFSDGSSIGFINGHGLFDLETNRYEELRIDNVAPFVGHRFAKGLGERTNVVTLVSYSIEQKETHSLTVVSSENINCEANGFLNITSVLKGIYNIYEYDENHNFHKEAMKRDLERYGEFSYEELADKIDRKKFVDLGFRDFKVAMGKGILDWDTLNFYIRWFAKCIANGEAIIY